MSNDELKALQTWINDGNSVYENTMMAAGYGKINAADYGKVLAGYKRYDIMT